MSLVSDQMTDVVHRLRAVVLVVVVRNRELDEQLLDVLDSGEEKEKD